MRDRVDKVVLGEGCVYSTDSNVTGINNNILVVGGSGSGKTVSIAEAFLLESYNRNIFFHYPSFSHCCNYISVI